MNPQFWHGKRVFLTGHTGFKGSWLALWLQQLGAEVTGYALEAPTTPALFDEARVAQGLKQHVIAGMETHHLLGAEVSGATLRRHRGGDPGIHVVGNRDGGTGVGDGRRRVAAIKGLGS